ncbi:MAG: serine/threonine-protein kinase, partial [Pseudomonadota bacterium]
MKTGDTVRDDQDRTYKVGLLLGRGTWGKTWRLTRDGDGADLVAKVPLTAADFPPSTPEPQRLASECREILLEQAALLGEGSYRFLPPPVALLEGPQGGSALVVERYPVSLEQRLLAGCSLAEALDILLQTARLAQQLRDGPGFHGALKPSNILLDAQGEVRLTDVVTPLARRAFPELVVAAPGECMLPPEIRGATGEPPFSAGADTYALGRLVWRAVMGGEAAAAFPVDGLDKVALVALKDRLHARIKQEDSNPRFHSRLADRLSSTLSRALSAKASPSPPYRFDRMDELVGRVEELRSLIRPEVVTVGRVLLDRPPNTTSFKTDEEVAFSVSVGCSPGVERHEEIGCGIAVFDRETGERVREVPSTFEVSRHPSGRFRFQFRMTGLRPGSYRLRVAFAIRDSGHEPQAGEVELEIWPGPGWVTPPEPPPAAPLRMRSQPEEGVTVTTPMAPEPAPAPPPPAPAPPRGPSAGAAGE